MISIPFNPKMFEIGNFVLSWHGFWSFVGVLVAIYLVAKWAKKDGLNPDLVYNTAVWGVLGGILGARIVHVLDYLPYYLDNPGKIFAVWSGGIGLWGGIIGGVLGGAIYAYIQKYPVGKLMDLTAPAMLIAQAIGRLGDVWNGEHLSRATDLPWGWIFTHPDSPGRRGAIELFQNPVQPVHPSVVYEIIWDLSVCWFIWGYRKSLKPDGSLWMLYMALYSVGRFLIQFTRMDSVKFWALQEAHIISLIIFTISVAFLIIYTRPINWVKNKDLSQDHPNKVTGKRKRRSLRDS